MLSRVDLALLSTYLRPVWPHVLLLGGLLVAGVGLQLLNPQLTRVFIDQAQAGEPFERLLWLAALFIAVALLTHVAGIAETSVAENIGWRTTNALRADLTRHVLSLDGAFHARHTTGELIERIDGDVSAIADFFARFVVQVLGSGAFVCGMLVLLWLEDWRIGAVLTLVSLSALAYMTRGGAFVGTRARAARQAAADLSAAFDERLAALPDLKTNGADGFAQAGVEERLAARFQATQRSTFAGSIFNATIAILFVLGSGAALALSAALHASSEITLGTIYVVFRYTSMLRMPIERLSREMHRFQQATGGIVRVLELQRTRPTITGGGGELAAGALSVELDDVSFAYGEGPVLRGVSCRVEPGEVLGLLGRTGSGKSTLARLLFRLYDPRSGTVRLGGTDLRTVRLAALHATVGLVTQDVQLLDGSVRDNVALWNPEVSDARLRAIFAELGLDSWLRSLPDGLDTLLGTGGRGLSAGEAQLVALARVFLKDPGLVVLDEASARLDPATEGLLEAAIGRLLDGRTSVLIAHRVRTLERVDRILVLADGQVVEHGRRAELAADPASYLARLLRAELSEVLA